MLYHAASTASTLLRGVLNDLICEQSPRRVAKVLIGLCSGGAAAAVRACAFGTWQTVHPPSIIGKTQWQLAVDVRIPTDWLECSSASDHATAGVARRIGGRENDQERSLTLFERTHAHAPMRMPVRYTCTVSLYVGLGLHRLPLRLQSAAASACVRAGPPPSQTWTWEQSQSRAEQGTQQSTHLES